MSRATASVRTPNRWDAEETSRSLSPDRRPIPNQRQRQSLDGWQFVLLKFDYRDAAEVCSESRIIPSSSSSIDVHLPTLHPSASVTLVGSRRPTLELN